MKFVKIPKKDFEMAANLCTQNIWTQVMDKNPSYFKGEQLPVENVSYNHVIEFIKTMNDFKDGYLYRLPTEKEWEYCCRAGSTTEYYFGDNKEDLEKYAWYNENSEERTHIVGSKLPNAWDLYDMHGNVWEWCDSFYDESASYRGLRGGSWFSDARSLRSAFRSGGSPDYRFSFVGFRLVRTLTSNSVTLHCPYGEQRPCPLPGCGTICKRNNQSAQIEPPLKKRIYWIAKRDPYDGKVYDIDPRTFQSGIDPSTVKKVQEIED